MHEHVFKFLFLYLKGRGAEHYCWAAQLTTEAQRWLACAQRCGTPLAAYTYYAPRKPMLPFSEI